MQIACQPHPLVYFSIRSNSKRQNGWKNVQNLHSRNLVKLVFVESQIRKFAMPLCKNRLNAIPNADDGHPSASMSEDIDSNPVLNSIAGELWDKWSPPRYLWRGLSVLFLTGQVIMRTLKGRIGSSYAAELGTMQVSEQTDTLRVLGSNPVDYLVTPRVIASCIALPILTLMCFTVGMASSALLADSVYGVSINIIIDSALRALKSWDIISAMIKSQVFGAIISIVSCAWGITTSGGAKGVGESTTSAVVISLVGIFVADFTLSCFFFQGAGDSLKNCM